MSADETLFSARDVARIFGLTESRVRYWAQTGFINPSSRKAGRRRYTFQDLVAIRAARELLDQGIPLQRVRKNLSALRSALPQLDLPLSHLRVQSDGEDLVVACEDGSFEPVSGQLLLDFDVQAVQRDASQILDLDQRRQPNPAPSSAGEIITHESGETDSTSPDTAQGWFLRGCALDSLDGHEDEALAAYEEALSLDPSLAAGLTNLGNLHYRQDRHEEALVCYERACALDPDQPEAHYNLANLLEEAGQLDLAIDEYRKVLQLNEDFRDAHFNLALTLEQVGGLNQAILHWERYLELSGVEQSVLDDEDMQWVNLARTHLNRLREEKG